MRVQGRNRRSREGGIVIPAEESRSVSSRHRECKIRILDGVAHRPHGACRTCGSVVQHIADRVDTRLTPLHVEMFVLKIPNPKSCHGMRECGIVKPALEGITRAGRRCERKVGTQDGVRSHRVRIRRRICRCVVRMVINLITVRAAPARIIVPVGCIHAVKRCDCRARKSCIIEPAEEGIARTRCRQKCKVRIEYCIAADRIRIACRVPRRCSVVQIPVHRIRLRCAPLRIILLILSIHGVKARDGRAGECCVVIPTLKVITGSRCRLQRDIRIQNGIACDRIRIVCRVTCRGSVIQVPVHRISLRCTPLCIKPLIRRIAGQEACDRGSGECRVIVPALKVVACPRRRSQGNIRIQYRIACHRIRIACGVTCRCAVI